MSGPALSVEKLSKMYRVGEGHAGHDTLYDTLAGLLRRKKAAAAADAFWALRDVSFEVAAGEVLGVVGRNGAGKSTLLKILSRITAPTEGRVTMRGRVSSLLEVGTGFHPELSGRENIELSATILGMRKREIAAKFDEIVAFSGVEKFLDTPVKRYSSGMYVRLAFAVAAHVDTDILLVDEVLAVGDAEFQKRCLGAMGDLARGGRAVIFVSHNLTALRNLCTLGLMLEQGRLRALGDMGSILEQYVGAGNTSREVKLPAARPGDSPARLSRIAVRPRNEDGNDEIRGSRGLDVIVEFDVFEREVVDVFLHCHNDSQVMVFSDGSFYDPANRGEALSPGRYAFRCEVPGHLLNDGRYTLDAMLVRARQDVIDSEMSIMGFNVVDDFGAPEGWHWRPAGVVRPKFRWHRERSGGIDTAA